jgi:hypothetical protein
MTETFVKIAIIPETYDYKDGDIVYRIYVSNLYNDDNQLVIERAMPVIEQNQALLENFILDNTKFPENRPKIFIFTIDVLTELGTKVVQLHVNNKLVATGQIKLPYKDVHDDVIVKIVMKNPNK